MAVHQIDPVQDPRWRLFLERHPHATVFHTPEWLTALQRTYGYEPAALTTAAPGESLSNGLVFCRVKSWLTGRRTTSLPFSDHCEPLVESPDVLERLLEGLKQDRRASRVRYVEIRPSSPPGEIPAGFSKADTFCLHQLSLLPSLEEIFGGFHKDCVQRKIRRAERDALRHEEGRSESLIEQFYSLLVLTRRRQRLLPQPRIWFRNLVACMGDMLKIRLASKDSNPVAAMLTLQYRDTLVYKYGCSDKTFSHLGGMQFLFWNAIQEGRNSGLCRMDLGRSDWDNPGLLTFKDRLGATRSVLEYWRYGAPRVSTHGGWQSRIAQRIFQHLPNNWLPVAGSLVYRHLA